MSTTVHPLSVCVSRFPYRQEEKTFPTTPVCGLQAASVHASGSRQVLSTVKRRTCAVSRGEKKQIKRKPTENRPTHTHTRIIRISPSRSSTERERGQRVETSPKLDGNRRGRGVWALISVHSPLPPPPGHVTLCPNEEGGARCRRSIKSS